MKVRAIEQGFYNGRRKVGDVFEVPDGARAKWWEVVETPKPTAKPAPAPRAKKAESDKPEKGDDDLV